MFLTIDKLSKLDYGDLTDIMNPQETNVAHIIEKIYQWWPANLNHGPTSRPTIDPETDDGGDAFEESAKYILDKTRFNLLRKTNNLIDQYQGGKPGIKILKNINGLIIQLSQYKEITKFKPKKWYQISHGALKKKWRVYKN
jgi:hypothetical protein